MSIGCKLIDLTIIHSYLVALLRCITYWIVYFKRAFFVVFWSSVDYDWVLAFSDFADIRKVNILNTLAVQYTAPYLFSLYCVYGFRSNDLEPYIKRYSPSRARLLIRLFIVCGDYILNLRDI
jgi:hypothetical protein